MAVRGTGPVEMNGAVVYAFYAGSREGLRIRMSLDEWERLGLHRGEWVEIRLPGRLTARWLLITWSEMPPWVWLDFDRGIQQVSHGRGVAVHRTIE